MTPEPVTQPKGTPVARGCAEVERVLIPTRRIPDVFVVGYGLGLAERYRNWPFLGVLRPQT
jgi:hypoxanthine-guanine phosphoribosyltransferase